MKKLFLLILVHIILIMPVLSKTDRNSAEYLKNKKHFAIANPISENIVEKVLKKALKKEIGSGKYKVQFKSYTLSSLKRGIFKNLEIIGKDIEIDDIPVPYLSIKSITDYNWIDFNEKPIKFKSDMVFEYNVDLDEVSINRALNSENYKKNLEKINNLAYPLFSLSNVDIRIKNNKLYIITTYSLPMSSSKRERRFIVATDFKVENGKILAKNISIDKSYGNISIQKIANLINLIDPLTFTLGLLNDDKCKSKVENVNIVDDIAKINGRIFVKGSN